MVRSRGTRILDQVINAEKKMVVNTDLIRQIFSSVSVLKELYHVESVKITDRLTYDNPQLGTLVSMLDEGQGFVFDIIDNNMITKRYIASQGIVKIYSTPYDLSTRAIITVNNYMFRLGFDQQYFINEVNEEILKILNECFLANIDRL